MTILCEEIPLGVLWASATFDVDADVSKCRGDGAYVGNEWVDREFVEAEITAVRLASINVFDEDGDELVVTAQHRVGALAWFYENKMDLARERALEGSR